MAKFYTKRFEKEVAKSMRSKLVKRKAHQVAQRIVRAAHEEMIDDFDSHPVTQEINMGPSAENISGTLGGYGNLFSFIGFERGRQPTRPIRKYLEKSGRVFMEPRVSGKHKDVIMKFKVDVPILYEIDDLSPSPWEGRSWTRSVESGITGLGYYMYSNSDDFGGRSRSTKAVQSSRELRKMAYRPIKYMTSILNKFYRRIA
jgi:hypothetical protein